MEKGDYDLTHIGRTSSALGSKPSGGTVTTRATRRRRPNDRELIATLLDFRILSCNTPPTPSKPRPTVSAQLLHPGRDARLLLREREKRLRRIPLRRLLHLCRHPIPTATCPTTPWFSRSMTKTNLVSAMGESVPSETGPPIELERPPNFDQKFDKVSN